MVTKVCRDLRYRSDPLGARFVDGTGEIGFAWKTASTAGMSMIDQKLSSVGLHHEAARLTQAVAEQAGNARGAAASLMIERLQRLEDVARSVGISRQMFQKIVSARRVLGDKTHSDPFKGPFVPD